MWDFNSSGRKKIKDSMKTVRGKNVCGRRKKPCAGEKKCYTVVVAPFYGAG
jgi:hypothetical protein